MLSGVNIIFVIMIYLFNCNWVDTRWQQYSTHSVDTQWQQYSTHFHTNSNTECRERDMHKNQKGKHCEKKNEKKIEQTETSDYK
jgi:hypothetical protein